MQVFARDFQKGSFLGEKQKSLPRHSVFHLLLEPCEARRSAMSPLRPSRLSLDDEKRWGSPDGAPPFPHHHISHFDKHLITMLFSLGEAALKVDSEHTHGSD